MNALTSGDNAAKKKQAIQWNADCKKAFQKLKQLCSSTPILAYADYSKPFKLHTDACGLGLGAVLYQKQDDGTDRVIAFASQALNKSEAKYPAHKLKFLALKWAITDRFHKYLYGGEFEVYTDNNPLTYVLTTAKLDATGQRWIASLANYNFNIHYKPGRNNIEADALSRIPRKMNADFTSQPGYYLNQTTLEGPVVKAIMNGCAAVLPMVKAYTGESSIAKGSHPFFTAAALTQSQKKAEEELASSGPACKFTNEKWQSEQSNDVDIGQIIQLLKTKELTKRKGSSNDSIDLHQMLRHKQQFVIQNKLLYRKTLLNQRDRPTMQFVLPTKYRKQAMEACHNGVGHLGIERSLNLLKD